MSDKAALDFLKKLYPEGPWVLTSIIPDGATTTRTFNKGEEDELCRWVAEREGVEGVYYNLNPTRRPLFKKSMKTDIERAAYFHVDVDPREGEPLLNEQDRALRLLQEYDRPPTAVVFSGGGYQGLWKLRDDERLVFHGDEEKAAELEAYNIQLSKEFGADHCHNIDRILRLPGVTNLPNRKKVKQGREPAMAELVSWDEGAVYSIDDFTAAVRVQGTDGLAGQYAPITISGNTPDVDVETLREWIEKNGKTVPESILAVIATGADPYEAGKYASRSEALFAVCCALVRADVPDEMIYGVVTGGNEIAASVREKPNPEQYATRQIQRAREMAIDPVLAELNGKHAVISDVGGKCRVISEVYDPAMKRACISKQTFEDIRNRYMNRKVEIGSDKDGHPKTTPAGKWWLEHEQRRQFETLVFSPGKSVEGAYNLWQGFSVDALPGTGHEQFLEHIRDNVCRGDDELYTYLLGWMARVVQYPDTPGEVAVVMRGKRGTGKSFFARELGRLFGRHFLQVSDSKHLVGSFNSHLRDTVLLFGDEAFFAGDRQHESVLKTLITEEHLVIEGKGVDAEAAPNYTHLLLASNDDWVVPAGTDERRFLVLDVGGGVQQDHGYFSRIKKNLENGGYESLLHYLMNYNLAEYEVRAVPHTEALQDQKMLSLPPEAQWLHNRLQEGKLHSRHSDWNPVIAVDMLWKDYVNEMRDTGRNFRMTKISLGRYLKSVLPEGWPERKIRVLDLPREGADGQERLVAQRVTVHIFPELDVCRESWDAHYGFKTDWADIRVEESYTDEDDPF